MCVMLGIVLVVGVIAAQGPMVRDRPAGAMRTVPAMCVVVDIVLVAPVPVLPAVEVPARDTAVL